MFCAFVCFSTELSVRGVRRVFNCSGDEGSGFYVGVQAIKRALEAEYGYQSTILTV